jgi:hypothetical protein
MDHSMQRNTNMRKHGFFSILLALALSACGGDDAFQGGPGGPGPAASPASLVVTSSTGSIPADGSLTAEINALIRDSNNVVIKNVPVTLSANSGALSVGSTATGEDGIARAALTTGGDQTPRNITVTARAGSFTSTVNIAVGGAAPSSNPVAALTMMSSASTIPSDGSQPATIVAIARDANNLLMSGVPVSFTASSGGLAVVQGVTGSNGQATATLSTAGDSTARNITVTASAGGLSSSSVVAVAPTSSTTTVSIGNGSGSSFTPNLLAVAVPSLSAGGSTSLTVSIVRQDGTLYTQPVTLNFNSPCVAANTAVIRNSGVVTSTVTTSTGQAILTYVAQGCAGLDRITATTTIGSQSLSATGDVTVAAATIGSIEFVGATPTNIALRGTGSSGRPETSTVVFRVRDSSNGPVSGATVNFALSTTVGGITLTSPSATSDSQGNVQAIVNAGTVATPVTVSATVAGTAIGTQSSQLSISTGIPTAGSFSLAVSCQNIEGLEYDGTIATVTARLADRFSNPVPDGTAVSFQAEGGSIISQCNTTTNANEGGVCSVDFRSSNPRPADGRITLLATAIGEESFIDADGNGAFTAPDTFRLLPAGLTPAHDLGEPYRDDNESAAYDVGEPFYDFYNVGAELNVRNPRDNLFNGALCNDGARCSIDPLKQRAGIGASNIIILSGSSPVVTLPGGGALVSRTITQNGSTTFDLWIRDVNGNPLPGGTTVTGAASGAGLTIIQPATSTVPCSSLPANAQAGGITRYSFTVTSATTVGTGSFVLSIRTPRNLTTTFVVNITVN